MSIHIWYFRQIKFEFQIFEINSRYGNSNVTANVYQMHYFCTYERISYRMIKKSFQLINFITQYGYALISADSDHQMITRQIISRAKFFIEPADK